MYFGMILLLINSHLIFYYYIFSSCTAGICLVYYSLIFLCTVNCMIMFILLFMNDTLTTTIIQEIVRFSRNFEANALEFFENIEVS